MTKAFSKTLLAAQLAGRQLNRPTPLVECAMQFSLNSRPSAKDIGDFKELFYTLIFKASAVDKKQISACLARGEYTPRTIAIFFALEEIAIATPMLLFSPVMGEADLNSVISKRDEPHARVIARRNNLQSSTVRKLLERDSDDEQLRRLLDSNATLKNDPEVARLLALPRSAFEKQEAPESLQPIPAKETKRVKVEAVPTKEKEPEQAKDLSAELMQLANVGGKIGRTETEGSGKFLVNTPALLERHLLENAREGNRAAIAWSVQQYCGLNHHKTLELLEQQDAGLLASLLIALGIRKLPACQLLLLLNRSIGRNAEVFKAVSRQLERLDPVACRKVFTAMGAEFSETGARPKPRVQASGFESALRERRNSLGGPVAPAVNLTPYPEPIVLTG